MKCQKRWGYIKELEMIKMDKRHEHWKKNEWKKGYKQEIKINTGYDIESMFIGFGLGFSIGVSVMLILAKIATG